VAEPQWAADPFQRFALRYWDGTQWTERVKDERGLESSDPTRGLPKPSVPASGSPIRPANSARPVPLADALAYGGAALVSIAVVFIDWLIDFEPAPGVSTSIRTLPPLVSLVGSIQDVDVGDLPETGAIMTSYFDVGWLATLAVAPRRQDGAIPGGFKRRRHPHRPRSVRVVRWSPSLG
jgi:hypothetical protein